MKASAQITTVTPPCDIRNKWGEFKLRIFRIQCNERLEDIAALYMNLPSEECLLRINSACITSEAFGDLSCDCNGKWTKRSLPYALPTPLGMAGRFELLLDGNREQRPGETKFVAVGVIEVEEALTPFSIVGPGSWPVSRCERTVVKCVKIGNVEDYPTPPGPAPLGRLGNALWSAS